MTRFVLVVVLLAALAGAAIGFDMLPVWSTFGIDEEGCGIDPDGCPRPGPTTDAGCGIDPYGRPGCIGGS